MHDLNQARRALEAVDLRQGLATAEVHVRLAQVNRLNDTGQRGLAFYLVEMEDRGLHQVTGHSSTAKYAQDRLDLPPRRTRELLAVGRKLLSLPLIDTAFCEGRLGWSKVLQLVKVASPEHEGAWLERALGSTCRELALEVKLVPAGRAPRKPGETKGLPEVRFELRASLDVLTHQLIELAKQKLSAERGEAIDDTQCLAVLAELFLNTEEDGSVPGRNHVPSSLYRIVLHSGDAGLHSGEDGLHSGEDAGLQVDTELGRVHIDGGEEDAELARVRSECARCDAEHVHGDDEDAAPRGEPDVKTPRALRQRVLVRDDQRCRCCGSRHGLMVHHIRFRSHGGATRAWNLITLCVSCHALVHADLLVLKGKRARNLRFLDSTGKPLSETGAPVDPRALLPLARSQVEGPTAEALAAEACAGKPAPEPQPIAEAFAGVVGQDALLERLAETVRGCRVLERPFPHLLLSGPPGTGKTTLARGVAAHLGARLVETMGPALQDAPALARVVGRLQKGDVLFIDEIHAVPRTMLESLYELLSENAFTLVGATTEEGDLPKPLHSRFGLRESLDFYSEDDLVELARTKARAEGFLLDEDGSRRLAESARGTPRELLRLLARLLEYGACRGLRSLGRNDVERTLRRLGFDADGLDPSERRYLALLRESRRPVPLGRLSRMLGTSVSTLIEHIEPFLFRRGLVHMTPNGREAANVRRFSKTREAANVRRLAYLPAAALN